MQARLIIGAVLAHMRELRPLDPPTTGTRGVLHGPAHVRVSFVPFSTAR